LTWTEIIILLDNIEKIEKKENRPQNEYEGNNTERTPLNSGNVEVINKFEDL